MRIFRQHAESELHEIVGNVCSKLIAVPSEEENVIYSLYMSVGNIWLRIFIQAGLLFVDECSGPDPRSASMQDGVFRVCLSHGIAFELREVASGTKISIGITI